MTKLTHFRLSKENHKKRHQELHKALEELLRDWLWHGNENMEETTLRDFVKWSVRQCKSPENMDELA